MLVMVSATDIPSEPLEAENVPTKVPMLIRTVKWTLKGMKGAEEESYYHLSSCHFNYPEQRSWDRDLIVKFNLSEAFSKFPSLTRNFHNSSLTMLARSLFFCLVFFILSSKLMKLVWQYFTDHIHFIISSLCDMWGDLLPGAQWYNHPGDGITLQSVFSGSIWGW